nr:MAG TPA: hypothetical protein [Bacteriophage sp.]DAW88734.1 MAG TPA: hypothetical protein [Bacteriophage sp.]
MLCLYIRLCAFLGVQVYPVGAACVLLNSPELATASTTCKGILYPFYATLPKAF